MARSALRDLRSSFRDGATWAERKYDQSRGSLQNFVRSVLGLAQSKFIETYGMKKLHRERLDEIVRDTAQRDQQALVRYWQFWEERIQQFQTAYPKTWRVPAMTQEEVRDKLLVQLLDKLKRPGLGPYEKTGNEATYAALVCMKDRLRTGRMVYEVPQDIEIGPFVSIPKNPEEEVAAVEQEKRISALFQKVKSLLSLPQRKWLAAALLEAKRDEAINFSRIAQQLDRHRSSGGRMRANIQEALRRLGAHELLEPS